MKGASAIRALTRSGSSGRSGRWSLTWSTLEQPAAVSSSAAARNARAREARLRRTGRLSRRLRVGRVELGEARVVAADVVVVGIDVERLLVLRERPREVAARLEGHGEVVVRARVVGRLLAGLLESER